MVILFIILSVALYFLFFRMSYESGKEIGGLTKEVEVLKTGGTILQRLTNLVDEIEEEVKRKTLTEEAAEKQRLIILGSVRGIEMLIKSMMGDFDSEDDGEIKKKIEEKEKEEPAVEAPSTEFKMA